MSYDLFLLIDKWNFYNEMAASVTDPKLATAYQESRSIVEAAIYQTALDHARVVK
jgi:hypothetical protein